MGNSHNPGDVEELRKLLDRLKKIGPLTLEDLLEDEPNKRSPGDAAAIREALEQALKRYRDC
ncbi:hypothetical protein [Tistlia consotensis]|uniref:hypothetical protein n=1 Tax=Tistlia consotensis TaxID=1321365 RepID=UPI000A150BEF|nr:hypothetical protein [Tistlia consotensis]